MGKKVDNTRVSGAPGPDSRRMRRPRIGIYAGGGTSHSWLWFVDMFEKMGFLDLVFLDQAAVQGGGLNFLDVFVISGGDTFAVAEALGQQGADHIKSFVEHGGVYIGSCAGAYLPMNSSKKPLDMFNFVDVKITNLSKTLPEPIKASCKFCTSYGCGFVFHPVREEVRLRSAGYASCPEFIAPMFGGPGMKVAAPSTVLAYYNGFTDKTSFLVHESIASKTLTGQAAIVRMPLGKGCFYLLGPHLEHPDYPAANQWVADAISRETAQVVEKPAPCHDPKTPNPTSNFEILSGPQAADFIRDLRRELSNSRIAASGLEFLPISWRIGKKVYEPEKVRVFLESMWKRVTRLEKRDRLYLRPGASDRMIQTARQTTRLLRKIKSGVDQCQDTLLDAISAFDLLHSLSISFFNLYFQADDGPGYHVPGSPGRRETHYSNVNSQLR